MKRCLVLLAVIGLFCGCSTLINGTKQDVIITTTPPGLSAQINTKQCTTPCTLKDVFRKTEMITVEGKDYRLEKSFNGWSTILGNWWNYILPGMAIDYLAGSTHTIEDVDIKVEVKPEKTVAISN